jgi:penicillin amidase
MTPLEKSIGQVAAFQYTPHKKRLSELLYDVPNFKKEGVMSSKFIVNITRLAIGLFTLFGFDTIAGAASKGGKAKAPQTRRTARWLFGAFVAAALFAPPLAPAQSTKTYVLDGLEKQAEILRDKWGVPHIYADTQDDLFFAQGFNAARDRLWQLDMWRRQGEGELAEQFGPRFVEQDRAARLFLYRGNMRREFESYHPDGEQILTAFANGINAYVDLVLAEPDLLPLEFKLTGARPGYWKPETSLIRIYGLTRNLSEEITNAQRVRALGADKVEQLSTFEPPVDLVVPPGLDLSQIDDRILQTYNLARGALTFRPEDFQASPLDLAERTVLAESLSTGSPQRRIESNNWTIAGRLTATGRPILSNDPHRALSIPSLRYMAHLNGPGWNIIGAGEPALPGISIGHNNRIAFGLTIFSFADEEDLYVYDTNPDNPSQYRYRNRWESMRVVRETIDVRGGAAVEVELKFTRHGPVIYEDPANRKAYAVRAAYLEFPGTAVYLASLRLDQARNWNQFQRGMERHYTPSENMVYADVDGNIGWMGGSIAPLRPNWTGMLPVPGNGDYEWEGFLDTSLLPRVFNPPQGFFATANEFNLPPAYPFTSLSARSWADPSRFSRIDEVLASGSRFTLEDSMRLQYDELSLPARELVPMLRGISSPNPESNAAIQALLSWDYVLSTDSVPTTIFELWQPRVIAKVSAIYIPPSGRTVFPSLDRRATLRFLMTDLASGDGKAKRDALLLEALGEALAEAKRLLGDNWVNWQWGTLHHAQINHVLSALVSPETRELLDTERVPKGGDGDTVHNTFFLPSFLPYRQLGGATYRQVIDVGEWDNSVWLNSPGQSGDPNSPHYKDLYAPWAEGTFMPMLFSRRMIERATDERVVLIPDRIR